jgi:hypothetical protein
LRAWVVGHAPMLASLAGDTDQAGGLERKLEPEPAAGRAPPLSVPARKPPKIRKHMGLSMDYWSSVIVISYSVLMGFIVD